MAKPHVYVLVSAEGACTLTKSNGPICFQQSRQEVGGHFESFDPQLGAGYTAQVNDGRGPHQLALNTVFQGVTGNVLIGRAHGTEMWGLSPAQQQEILSRVKRVEQPVTNQP